MTDASGSESGQEFRQKFEDTQNENAELRQQVAGLVGVDHEQLKGIPANQLVEKANEIKTAKKTADDAVVRQALGLGPEDDLEAALAAVKGDGAGSTGGSESSSAPTPFTSTGQLGGDGPGARSAEPPEGAFGRDRILFAIQQEKKKK